MLRLFLRFHIHAFENNILYSTLSDRIRRHVKLQTLKVTDVEMIG